MGQIIPQLVRELDFGITNNIRIGDPRYAQMVKHFDIFQKKNALIPYRDSEDGSSGGDTDKLSKFLYYGSKTFSLGVVSGTARVKIFEMATFSGNSWSATTNGADSGGARSEDCFIEYKGYAYGWAAGTRIWKADLSGGAAFTTSERSANYTAVCQGVVHSKDDILYMPYDNKIEKNNAGSWSTALTLPSNLVIVSISEYGNYLAIGCKPSNGIGRCVTYLWDRDSSLTTLSESIDFGTGELKLIEEIEGSLIGISIIGNSSSAFVPKVVFSEWQGGSSAKVLPSMTITSSSTPIIRWKQKVNGRMYFGMIVTIDGVIQEGIWSMGTNSRGVFVLSLDRLPNNDTTLTSGQPLGHILVGDYMFIAYLDNSAYAVSKTNDQSSFTATSIYETIIFDGGDPDIKKKLIGFTSFFEPLIAAGVIRVYFKKDAESTWTRIFTFGTDDEISHGAVLRESDSDAFTVTIATPAVFTLADHGLVAGNRVRFATTGALPTGLTAGAEYYVIATGLTSSTFRVSTTLGGSAVNTTGSQSGVHTIVRNNNLPEFKEIRFRVESKGGGVPTGFKFKMETLDKALY